MLEGRELVGENGREGGGERPRETEAGRGGYHSNCQSNVKDVSISCGFRNETFLNGK